MEEIIFHFLAGRTNEKTSSMNVEIHPLRCPSAVSINGLSLYSLMLTLDKYMEMEDFSKTHRGEQNPSVKAGIDDIYSVPDQGARDRLTEK